MYFLCTLYIVIARYIKYNMNTWYILYATLKCERGYFMKKFWFGMVANWDYMITFGHIVDAESEEEAIRLVKLCHPNCTIQKMVLMGNI